MTSDETRLLFNCSTRSRDWGGGQAGVAGSVRRYDTRGHAQRGPDLRMSFGGQGANASRSQRGGLGAGSRRVMGSSMFRDLVKAVGTFRLVPAVDNSRNPETGPEQKLGASRAPVYARGTICALPKNRAPERGDSSPGVPTARHLV